MAKAYWVSAYRSIRNQEALAAYAKLAGPALEAAGGRFLVRGMEEVVRECTLRQCFRVLLEERLEGPRLGTLDVFEMVATGSTRFVRTLKAMAYVDVNAHSGEMMQFAENVAVNRAFPVRVFPTVLAAERWLEAEQQRSVSPGAADTALRGSVDKHKPRR